MKQKIVYVFPTNMVVEGNTIPAGYYHWTDHFTHITAHYMGEVYENVFSFKEFSASYQDAQELHDNEEIFIGHHYPIMVERV